MWQRKWPFPTGRGTRWSTNGSLSRDLHRAAKAWRVERALAVLNALLSFYPETTLTGEDDLIVFPSNEQLCLRTHGMPASTLRRLLSALVDAGLIVRRDSPNGKRYARKGREGRLSSLSVLTSRRSSYELVNSSAWRRRSRPRSEPSG